MVSTPRALLAITAGTSAGYIIAICWAGLATPRGIGVAVAIIAACVLGFYLVKAIEEDGQRERDKARHLASAPWYIVRDTPSGLTETYLKPWPIGDDEVRQ